MASTPRIIDQWGNPVSSRRLTDEVAAPTLGSVRSVWTESVLAGLDPAGMAGLLQQASRGWPDRFFILAEEMEERDLHYASVLSTRKRAITGVTPIVVEGSDDAKGRKIAEAVRDLVGRPEFVDDYVTDLQDGLGKGYAIVETIWDRSGREWWPQRYAWRSPLHFQVDEVDGRTLRMKDPASRFGIDLPPFQFSVHRPKLKSGLPIRGGLARLAAWAFLFKNYSLKDWMAFLEVFGMPLRVGKYGKGSSQEERRVLLRAVREISTDAAAIIPKEMEIEFHEVTGSSGNNLFSAMAEYLDKQVSKGVLGQTMSTDDGSSMSQAVVHENVRHDIARADARQTAVTCNRDLIRPFVDLNFGPQEKYPTIVFPITEPEDVKALADVVTRLVPLGLEVSMGEVRTRIGFEDPEPGEVLLAAPKPPPAPAPNVDEPPKPEPDPAKDDAVPAAARLAPVCPGCGKRHALAADETGSAGGDALDALVEEALADWQQDLEPLFSALKDLFSSAGSYDEIRDGLTALAGTGDRRLAERIARLTMTARGLGDLGRGR